MDNSRIVGLSEAWAHLSESETTKESAGCFWYFGAGISAGSVPLAEELARDCLDRMSDDSVFLWGQKQSQGYDRFLEMAWPDDESRSLYLEGLCQSPPTPAARLAARLLMGAVPGTLAVTGNFDPGLTRAVLDQGERPRVEGDEAFRLCSDPESPVHLIHTHGGPRNYRLDLVSSGYPVHYDEPPELTPEEEQLAELLRSRSALVLGFSGREDNPFMRALYQVICADGLGGPLLWFLYREDEWYGLPVWLTDHEQVFFVRGENNAGPKAAVPFKEDYLNRYLDLSLHRIAGEVGTDGVLSARKVLGSAVDHWEVPLVPLLVDPGRFVADWRIRLARRVADGEHILWDEKLTVQNAGADEGDGLASIRRALQFRRFDQALEQMRELDLSERSGEEKTRFLDLLVYLAGQAEGQWNEDQLEILNRAIRLTAEPAGEQREHYRIFLVDRLARGLHAQGKSGDGLTLVLWALESPGTSGEGMEHRDRLRFLGTELAVAAGSFEEAWALADADSAETAWGKDQVPLLSAWIAMHQGNYEKAAELLENARHRTFEQDVLAALTDFNREQYDGLDRVLDALASRAEKEQANPVLACTLHYLRAETIERKKADPQPIKAWNRILNRHERSFETPIRLMRALAYYKKAQVLRQTGSLIESTKVIAQMTEDFSRDRDRDIRLLCARGQLDAIRVKKDLKWLEAALDDCGLFLNAERDPGDLEMRELVTQVHYLKGIMLRDLGHDEQAIQAMEALGGDRSEDDSLTIRKYAARAMRETVALYLKADDPVAAALVCVRMVETLDDQDHQELMDILSDGYRIGAQLQAKQTDQEPALELALRGIRRLDKQEGLDVKRNRATLFMVAAGCLEELDRKEEVVSLMEDFEKAFGGEADLAVRVLLSRGWLHKGQMQEERGRPEEALETYEGYLKRFDQLETEETAPDLLDVLYRRGLLNKAVGKPLLGQQSLEQLIDRGVRFDQEMHWQKLALGWLEKAALHREEEQYREQLATLDGMIGYFEQRTDLSVFAPLVRAYLQRAEVHLAEDHPDRALEELMTLRHKGLSDMTAETSGLYARAARLEAGLIRHQHAFERLENVTEEVAAALWTIGALGVEEDLLAVLQIFQEELLSRQDHKGIVHNSGRIVGRFGDSQEPAFRVAVAEALTEKAKSLYAMREHVLLKGHHEASMALLANRQEAAEIRARGQIMHLMADDLRETGGYQESMAICQQIMDDPVFGASAASEDIRMLAEYKKARIHSGLGNARMALDLYAKLEREGRPAAGEVQKTLFYKALVEQAVLLDETGGGGLWGRKSHRKALRLLDRVIGDLASEQENDRVKIRLKALIRKGQMLRTAGRSQEARQALMSAVESNSALTDPRAVSLVEEAKKELDKDEAL